MHVCGSGCGSMPTTKQETKRSVSLVDRQRHTAVWQQGLVPHGREGCEQKTRWGVYPGQALCACLWLLHTENQLIKEMLGLSGKLER